MITVVKNLKKKRKKRKKILRFCKIRSRGSYIVSKDVTTKQQGFLEMTM